MKMVNSTNKTDTSSLFLKLSSALFYALCSIAVVFMNKILLTNYRFPSFLYIAFGQLLTTVLILFILKMLKLLSFPRLDSSVPRKIFPLPILYGVNLISGLGGTQRISLPMFTVLRRFSIFLTMLLEYFVLGEMPTFGVKFSVFLMIFGSAVAAVFDLSFDFFGYTFIFVNNFATAANGIFICSIILTATFFLTLNSGTIFESLPMYIFIVYVAGRERAGFGVYTKKKLDSKELGKSGLLFYNSLFMLVPLSAIILVHSDDTEKLLSYIENGYLTVSVLAYFILCSLGGIILNYSTVLCTSHNSALTTACVGPIKNMLVTYIGMFSSGDYVFSLSNFVGINISVFGSILYTYVTLRKNHKARQVTVLPAEKVALIA